MTRRLRCRLGWHKWVVRQDSRDAPRYHSCIYCDKIMDQVGRPIGDLGGG